mmetsp:Transcript_18898/g.38474  ORF Transcript_18898/g.38474 Transcript_18898/m.38474 type:complete len:99 (+) Transcript_18898:81-377(+)
MWVHVHNSAHVCAQIARQGEAEHARVQQTQPTVTQPRSRTIGLRPRIHFELSPVHSPSVISTAHKLNELYMQWFAQNEAEDLATSLLSRMLILPPRTP